ncbi:methyltransferase domain, partial [Schistosoma japonicum]
ADRLHQYFAHHFSSNLKNPRSNIYSRYLYHISLKKQSYNVLEIGFGRGYGLQLAAKRVAPIAVSHLETKPIQFLVERLLSGPIIKSDSIFANDGHVYGVETSHYMMRAALLKVWPLMCAKCVDINMMSVDHLNHAASSMHACFHVNCFYFWPSLIYSLQRIWRVLLPYGRLVTTFQVDQLADFNQRGWFQYGNPDPLSYVMALEACGYDKIEWLKQRTELNSQESYDCIIARKPPVLLLDTPHS